MIVDSTNPRIMANNIRELARNSGGGGSDLSEVTAADNGKVLGVVEGSWNKMDAPSGGTNYSETEQNTGLKWVDGRDIYKKTIVLSNTDVGYDGVVHSEIPHNITDFDFAISLEVLCPKLRYSAYSEILHDGSVLASFRVDSTNIYADGGSSHIGAGEDRIWYFIITYVKQTVTKKRKTTKGEN